MATRERAGAKACVACGRSSLKTLFVQMSKRASAFFGVDVLDRSARCSLCADCGHVDWFDRRRRDGVFATEAEGASNGDGDGVAWQSADPCPGCGDRRSLPGSASQVVTTRLSTFFGLEWMKPRVTGDTCVGCGRIHWVSAQGAGWPVHARPSTDGRVACVHCGGATFHERRGQLNRRAMTFFGIDFLAPAANVRRCTDCGTVAWFTKQPVARAPQ